MLSKYNDLSKLKYPIIFRYLNNPSEKHLFMSFNNLNIFVSDWEYDNELFLKQIFYLRDSDDKEYSQIELTPDKQTIIDFIKKQFVENDFDRSKKITDTLEYFDTYNEFISFQKAVIFNLKNMDKLNMIIELITNNEIQNMDKESMIPFPTSGFYFKDNSSLVLFNDI